MALVIVDAPQRGKDPIEVDAETVQEFIDAMPNVAPGKMIRNDMFFDTESAANSYGQKLIAAMCKAEPFMFLNTEDQPRLGLTKRQHPENKKWTCNIRNWPRGDSKTASNTIESVNDLPDGTESDSE